MLRFANVWRRQLFAPNSAATPGSPILSGSTYRLAYSYSFDTRLTTSSRTAQNPSR